MGKKFIEVAKNCDDFERIMFCVRIAESVSGKKVSKKTILDVIKSKQIILTEVQLKAIETGFE